MSWVQRLSPPERRSVHLPETRLKSAHEAHALQWDTKSINWNNTLI